MKNEYSEFEWIIPIRKNDTSIAFTGFFLAGFALGTILFSTLLINGFGDLQSDSSEFLFPLIAHIIITIYFLNIFLWHSRGKEIIKIHKGLLTIGQKGKLFNKSNSYQISEIKNLQVRSGEFGQKGLQFIKELLVTGNLGLISFEHRGINVRFMSNTEKEKADIIATKISENIKH